MLRRARAWCNSQQNGFSRSHVQLDRFGRVVCPETRRIVTITHPPKATAAAAFRGAGVWPARFLGYENYFAEDALPIVDEEGKEEESVRSSSEPASSSEASASASASEDASTASDDDDASTGSSSYESYTASSSYESGDESSAGAAWAAGAAGAGAAAGAGTAYATDSGELDYTGPELAHSAELDYNGSHEMV